MSDAEELRAEFVRLGSDTDPDVACFAAESDMSTFISSCCLGGDASRGNILASSVLHKPGNQFNGGVGGGLHSANFVGSLPIVGLGRDESVNSPTNHLSAIIFNKTCSKTLQMTERTPVIAFS